MICKRPSLNVVSSDHTHHGFLTSKRQKVHRHNAPAWSRHQTGLSCNVGFPIGGVCNSRSRLPIPCHVCAMHGCQRFILWGLCVYLQMSRAKVCVHRQYMFYLLFDGVTLAKLCIDLFMLCMNLSHGASLCSCFCSCSWGYSSLSSSNQQVESSNIGVSG